MIRVQKTHLYGFWNDLLDCFPDLSSVTDETIVIVEIFSSICWVQEATKRDPGIFCKKTACCEIGKQSKCRNSREYNGMSSNSGIEHLTRYMAFLKLHIGILNYLMQSCVTWLRIVTFHNVTYIAWKSQEWICTLMFDDHSGNEVKLKLR